MQVVGLEAMARERDENVLLYKPGISSTGRSVVCPVLEGRLHIVEWFTKPAACADEGADPKVGIDFGQVVACRRLKYKIALTNESLPPVSFELPDWYYE